MTAKFDLGRLVGTPGALEALQDLGIHPFTLLERHSAGDWGDMSQPDKEANDQALVEGSRIFSSYKLKSETFWVITEADRSSTCILLPHEY